MSKFNDNNIKNYNIAEVNMSNNDIVYFELNNWFAGEDFPDDEPFIGWMSDDLHIRFRNEAWVKENKLCVVACFVDMSQNFCVTATKDWVQENCPKLLTDYQRFIREPEDEEYPDEVYGRFGHEFLQYCEDNIGIEWTEDW